MIAIEEVADLIRKELRGRKADELILQRDTRLEDMGLSSLQVSEIVFGLEEEHEVEFDEARAADAKTLGDVVDLANEAIGKRDGIVEAA